MSDDRERGSVLVLVLLIALVLTALGLTSIYLASSGMKVSGNITRRQEALASTETGREHAMWVLGRTTNWDLLLQGCGHPRDAATTKGVVLCDPVGGGGGIADVPVLELGSQSHTRLPGLAKMTYTVYIRNDDLEVSRGLRYDDQDHRVVLRIEGVGRDGLSYVAVENVVLSTLVEVEDPYGQHGGGGGNTGSAKVSMAHPTP
jgi:hypothetical protein